jgi:hypothetical protein
MTHDSFIEEAISIASMGRFDTALVASDLHSELHLQKGEQCR